MRSRPLERGEASGYRSQAEPTYIEVGLYVSPNHPSYYELPQVVRIGHPAPGVLFPEAEFSAVSSASQSPENTLRQQVTLQADLAQERRDIIDLFRDVGTAPRGRYKAKSLLSKLTQVDTRIHETIDLAAANPNLPLDAEIIHNIVSQRLFGTPASRQEFKETWQAYLAMIGRHNASKRDRLVLVIAQSIRKVERRNLLHEAA